METPQSPKQKAAELMETFSKLGPTTTSIPHTKWICKFVILEIQKAKEQNYSDSYLSEILIILNKI